LPTDENPATRDVCLSDGAVGRQTAGAACQPAPTSGERSDHPRAWGGIGHWTWTLGSWNALEVVDALDPGVVVLVPVLIGGTCMQLRHGTFPFLVIISKGVSIAGITNQHIGSSMCSGRNALSGRSLPRVGRRQEPRSAAVLALTRQFGEPGTSHFHYGICKECGPTQLLKLNS